MFTKEELEEALRAIESTIGKCEKVLPKLHQGTSQHTLLTRRIKALEISAALIVQEMRRFPSSESHSVPESRRLPGRIE